MSKIIFLVLLVASPGASFWLPLPAYALPGISAISSEILQQRDPFKEPKIKMNEAGPQSELELFPIERLKLMGVVTGEGRPRAMVRAPNGKTYFVTEKMPIGDRKGVIKRITDKAILVREKVVNVLGQEEIVDSTIDLPVEVKQDVKQITSEQGW